MFAIINVIQSRVDFHQLAVVFHISLQAIKNSRQVVVKLVKVHCKSHWNLKSLYLILLFCFCFLFVSFFFFLQSTCNHSNMLMTKACITREIPATSQGRFPVLSGCKMIADWSLGLCYYILNDFVLHCIGYVWIRGERGRLLVVQSSRTFWADRWCGFPIQKSLIKMRIEEFSLFHIYNN